MLPDQPIRGLVWSHTEAHRSRGAWTPSVKTTSLTDSEMRTLYERYLEERSEKLEVAKSALSQVVNTLLGHIDHADGHFSSFSNELGDIAISLAGDTSAGDLNSLMDRAMQATNAALERGVEMKLKLSNLATEMDEVRDKLARSQEAARVDALTGVNNRLAFQEELAGLPGSADQDAHAPCLLIIDLDFFKRINDGYGHPLSIARIVRSIFPRRVGAIG